MSTARDDLENFNQVVYLLPTQSGDYWAIPNGDSVQYFGSACDPENTACILSGSDPGGTTYARLQISHDSTPAGYDNADLSGSPTTFAVGSGDQLWCVSHGHPVTLEFRVRWSADYSQTGLSDVAVGSSGFGVWNSPIQSDGSIGPATAIFFTWVDGIGLSSVISKAIDNQTTFLSFESVPITVDMQDWTEFKVEVNRLGSGADLVKLYVQNLAGAYHHTETEVVSGGLGCLSLESWNDIQSYDFQGTFQLQNPPFGETQEMDMDWYHFSQP